GPEVGILADPAWAQHAAVAHFEQATFEVIRHESLRPLLAMRRSHSRRRRPPEPAILRRPRRRCHTPYTRRLAAAAGELGRPRVRPQTDPSGQSQGPAEWHRA